MTPRRRRSAGGRGRRAQRNEAARLTDQLIAEGFSKKQVGEILGRNPSLVSQFFTKNKGASFVEALRAVVQEVQAGGPRDMESLKALAAGHVRPRLNREGYKARVRGKNHGRAEKVVKDEKGRTVIGPDGKPVKAWSSSLAKAGRQHIASGASRLLPCTVETMSTPGAATPGKERSRMTPAVWPTPPASDVMSSSGPTAPRKGPTTRILAVPAPENRASMPSSSRPWSMPPAATSPPRCATGSS